MELINKSVVVAEIERLYQEHSSKEYIDEGGVVLKQLEDFLDTLEVKEVDLEKEFKDFIHCDNGRGIFEIAKHFYELGLKSK